LKTQEVVTVAPRNIRLIESCKELLLRISDDHYSKQGAAKTPAVSSQQAQTLKLLDDLYEELEEVFYSKRGYIIPSKERQKIDATGGSATYGEAMPEGIQRMVELLPFGPDCTFVDLGSGLGRMVIQMACTTQVCKSVGIELSATRQDQAEWVLQEARSRWPDLASRLDAVELVTDDVTRCNLEGGTHFFLCSTAFSASACRNIADRLVELRSFRVLLTSRQLPPIASLRKVGEFPCEFSWNLGGTAHVYVRNNLPEAPLEVLTAFLCNGSACWLPDNRTLHVAMAVEEGVAACDGGELKGFQQVEGFKYDHSCQ